MIKIGSNAKIEEVSKNKEKKKKANKEIPYVFFITIFISGMIGLLASSLVLRIFSDKNNDSVKEELIKSN